MTRWSRRILDKTVAIVLILTLITTGLGTFLYSNWKLKQRSYFAQHQEILQTSYNASIQMYRLAIEAFYANTIRQPDFLALFAEGVTGTGKERNLAKGRLFRLLLSQYRAMKKQSILQLHFHKADGSSYLRFHKPVKHGDDLMDVRHSVRIANTEKRPVHGFETGRVRSGFRYVYPIAWKGVHLGSVEVGVTTKGIRDAMAELDPNREYAFLLNRHFVEPYIFSEQKWLYSTSMLNPGYIMEDADAILPDSPPPLSDEAKAIDRDLFLDQDVQSAMSRGQGMTVSSYSEGRCFLVSLLPIRDVAGQLAGYLVTYAPDQVTKTYRKEFFVYLAVAVSALSVIGMLMLGLRKRSDALIREQRDIKVINDTLAEGVYVMDPEGTIVRVNPSACRILGYEPDELLGQTAHDKLHSHEGNAFIQKSDCPFFTQVSRGQVYDGEERFLHKSGAILIVEVASRPIYMHNELVGSVTAFHDITERKRTEKALRKSEETARKLSIAVEQSPASIVITNTEGTIEYVNPKFVESTGYTFSEAVGKNPNLLQSGTMDRRVYEEMWETLSAGQEWKGELHNRCKNGALYWEFASISPIRNEKGGVTHYVAVKEDVTERKRMEEALREKELIQRTLMQRLPVGLVVIDAQSKRIESVNPIASELFGAPESSVVGNLCHQFMCPAEENRCPILDLGQVVDSSDRVLIRNNKTQIPVLKTVNRIMIQGREKLLECIVDIRSRVKAEKALKQANEKLKAAISRAEELAEKAESANRAKSIFLANMSHEIRTPLNAVLGHSQLLQHDEALGAEQRQQVATINRSGDHLLELINGILAMSKIEAGHVKIHRESMDFHKLIEDIDAIFRLACQKKNLWLKLETDRRVPKNILADRGKVRQILINLVSNAVKFTRKGGITLACDVNSVEDSSRTLTIHIKDTGSGIDKTEQEKLFEAFEQTSSGQVSSEGTGLGLSISRAYAKAMGGDLILVDSKIGAGSVFQFSFPFQSDEHGSVVEGPFVCSSDARCPEKKSSGMKVLVVEDDPISRMLLKNSISEAGMETVTVESGEEALETFGPFAPDLVVLDILLPGIDGYETCRLLRRMPNGEKAKVLIVTATGINKEEIREKVAASGGDTFVTKPFKPDIIVEKIYALCGPSVQNSEIEQPHSWEMEADAAVETVLRLPERLRRSLRAAVEMGDMQSFEVLSAEVVSINSGLAGKLKGLAHQYDYASLLALLSAREEKIEEPRGER
jgi:PAS domain S-box-containing protein